MTSNAGDSSPRSALEDQSYTHSLAAAARETSAAKGPIPFSQRKIKTDGGATILGSRDALAERRRQMFARKVQEKRGDRRWEVRGEDVSILFSITA